MKTLGTSLESSGRLVGAVKALAYAAAITPDADASHTIDVGTLTGAMTINAPSGTAVDGQILTFRFKQDATGGRVITWNAIYQFGLDLTTALVPLDPNAIWQQTFHYHAGDIKWRAASLLRIAGSEYGVSRILNGVSDTSGTSHIVLQPRSGALYAFGDSQSAGANGASQPYTSGGFLLPAFRWVNMLGTRRDRALTINNQAVGGSKISWGGTNDVSHLNAMGDLPFNWAGLTTIMGGWNNTDSGTTTTAFYTVMQRAFEALIARTLIDDWAGVTYLGWSRASGGGATYGWASTGTNNQYTTGATNLIPFNIATGLAARYRTALTSGQTISFSISGKRAIALFFETDPAGGNFDVTVNGSSVGTWNNAYPGIGGNDPIGHDYPMVVWLDDLTPSVTVKITNKTGTQYFLAFGWVDTDANGSLIPKRQILVGCPPGNTINGRATTMLYELAKRTQLAVGAFSQYPVFFANTYDHWIQATDSEPTDGSHLTPLGNEHIFQAFDAAEKVGDFDSPNVIRQKQFLNSRIHQMILLRMLAPRL